MHYSGLDSRGPPPGFLILLTVAKDGFHSSSLVHSKCAVFIELMILQLFTQSLILSSLLERQLLGKGARESCLFGCPCEISPEFLLSHSGTRYFGQSQLPVLGVKSLVQITEIDVEQEIESGTVVFFC